MNLMLHVVRWQTQKKIITTIIIPHYIEGQPSRPPSKIILVFTSSNNKKTNNNGLKYDF